ncbi:MAG TPA: hypothetical protein VMV45_12680, partial [Casimicrobiaceae bacterium]|nr:hypothetical protein [Casimicrobiaceae bacterium]
GSGARPVDALPSVGVRVQSTRGRRERDRDIRKLHEALQRLPTPIVGRIDNGALVLDCRCATEPDELSSALSALHNTLSTSSPARDDALL